MADKLLLEVPVPGGRSTIRMSSSSHRTSLRVWSTMRAPSGVFRDRVDITVPETERHYLQAEGGDRLNIGSRVASHDRMKLMAGLPWRKPIIGKEAFSRRTPSISGTFGP